MEQVRKSRQPAGLALALAVGGIGLGVAAGEADAGSQRKILVLSVSEDGRQNEGLRSALGELVEQTGALLVAPPGLSAAARACSEPSCLTALAREHDVDLIVAARLERHGKHERLVDLWAFDEGRSADTQERDLCDARDLKDCVSALGARVLSKLSSGRAPTPGAQGGGAVDSPSAGGENRAASAGPRAQGKASTPRGTPTLLPTWRLALGLGLGGLSAISLAGAIAATAGHGSAGPSQCPQGSETECRYGLTPVFVPAYVAAGVAALGAALTLAWPSTPRSKKESMR